MALVSFVLLQLTQELTIEVRNVHEPPVSITMSPCQPGLYPVNSPSVNESSVAGSCVALVQAIDKEPNQLLGFTLDDDSNGLFSLSFSTTNCTLTVRLGLAVITPMHYSAFRIFSQTFFDFKKSISGLIELKISGKTLYAILYPQISSLVGLFLK